MGGHMMRSSVVGFCALLLLASVTGSDAYTAQEFQNVPFTHTNDSFYNWDFESKDAAIDADRTRVDNPMQLLFYGAAEVDKVKGILKAYGFTHPGHTAYARLDDGPGAGQPDADRGLKTAFCPGLPGQPDDDIHYRVYAPNPPGHMTNARRTLRSYVLATTHYDTLECTPSPEFGDSEAAASVISAYMKDRFGDRAVDDAYADWKNDEPDGPVGNHFIQTDGKGTRIRIPAKKRRTGSCC